MWKRVEKSLVCGSEAVCANGLLKMSGNLFTVVLKISDLLSINLNSPIILSMYVNLKVHKA